jgi:signal transduction histidine kinase
MVAFAGYPLVVGDELVGVMALFARQPLAPEDFDALGTGATAIAVAIRNARLLVAEREARRLAETANRAKSEFLGTMSHELRTPLNAIGGYAELLSLGVRGAVNPEQLEDLGRIQRAGRHLQSLISDILNYARLDAGQVQYDLRTVQLEEVIADAEELIAPQLAEAGITFDRTAAGRDGASRCTVYTDPEKLRQILLNLLTNAIKFTPPGGRIGVGCTGHRDHVEVTVSDTGRGIPKDQLARIFEPFVQIDRSQVQASQQGIGLGLAISRDLARGMSGDLTVESEVGVGSTFTLTVPRTPE